MTDFKYDGSRINEGVNRLKWELSQELSREAASKLLKCPEQDLHYYSNKMFTLIDHDPGREPVLAVSNHDGKFRLYARRTLKKEVSQ